MIPIFILFFLIAILVYGSVNFYIGKRLWQGLFSYFPFINPKVYFLIFVLIAFSYFLARFNIKKLPIINTILDVIGSFWFAIILYSLLIVLLVDLFRFTNYIFKFTDISKVFTPFRLMVFSSSLVVFILFLMVYGFINAHSNTVINDYFIKPETKLSRNYNIVVVSDIHIGSLITRNRMAHMVTQINCLDPDIVIIAGDIIDNNIEPFIEKGFDKEFLKLNSRFGVYGILGNHDNFGRDIKKTIATFKKANIKMLIDETDIINNEINIIGRNDYSVGRSNNSSRKDLSSLIKNLDMSKYTILADHQPKEIDEVSSHKIDLMVSGHTHAGQFFPVGIITNLIYENHWGQEIFDTTNQVVSCGFGTWGPPIRIGTHSEIVNIHLGNFKK